MTEREMRSRESLTSLTASSKQRIPLYRISTRSLNSLNLVKLCLSQFALFDSFRPILVEILARTAVVVDAVPLLGGS